MRQYILTRVLFAIPAMIGVSIIVFGLVRIIPGDAVLMMIAETGNVNEGEIGRIREILGLSRPAHEQYIIWISNVVRGDFGQSLWTGKPVLSEILKRLPVTGELALLAILVSLIIALPAGVLSAVRQDTWLDYVARLISILGLSIPGFWIGLLLIVIPSIYFGWTPPFGFKPLFKDPAGNFQQFMLPALAMGAAMSASVMRMTRSSLLEVLRQDYIRTAWAKGLRERTVVYRHALKNALIPVVTVIGLQFGGLLGGTVIMEQIFSLPGIGRLTLEAINQRDYPQLQGNVLFLATVFVIVNLIVDVTYAWLDPRIHYQ